MIQCETKRVSARTSYISPLFLILSEQTQQIMREFLGSQFQDRSRFLTSNFQQVS